MTAYNIFFSTNRGASMSTYNIHFCTKIVKDIYLIYSYLELSFTIFVRTVPKLDFIISKCFHKNTNTLY